MIGEPISHYEILDKLGEGGMGVVYKARDLRLQRLVALKFLPPEITASPERIARFEQEARAVSTLNHPHISTIHAMDEDAGRRFLVLEYLPGGTLRQRLDDLRARSRAFPLRDVVLIGVNVARGLAHAHRKGIVHRDIKPENVMFDGEGMLRITDFGLAKTASSEFALLTRDGTTVGTAAYMAPEQALRNETSPRSDLFSLGVVLYELIVGQRPFSGASEFAAMSAVVNDPIVPPARLRPGMPPELERIVLRLLEKDPARRYQTSEEVATDLDALAPIPDGPSTAELDYFGPTRTMIATPQATLAAKSTSRLRAGIAFTTLLIAGLAVIAGLNWRKLRGPAPVTQLAVLPFTARSNTAEDVAFGNGLAGIISARLAALGTKLQIIPDDDVRQNRVATPIDAKKTFGVAAVLTGEVERQPSGAAVRIHLVDTTSGKMLRSASVNPHDGDRPLEEDVIRDAAALLGLSLDDLALGKLRADGSRAANAYDYYVLGAGYLQRYDLAGNTSSARAAFERAIHLDPSYAMAYAGLSDAYMRQYLDSGELQYLEKARDAANQALSRNETMGSPHITLGMIAMFTGDTSEGIRQFKAALDRDPVNAETYRQLGAAYDQAGNVAQAEATYNRAIQLRPNFWLGYLDSATFYDKYGRYAEAEKALITASGLTPDNYLVYRFLGAVQMKRGEWAAAESNLNKALALRPGGSVYSNLGTLYLYTGRYSEAIPMLEQSVKIGGGNKNFSFTIWGNLGDAYRFTPGSEAAAGEAYRQAIEIAGKQLAINPNDGRLLGQIAVYQAKRKNFAEADRRIKAARKAAPGNLDVLFDWALILEIEGKTSESLAALKDALAAGFSLSIVESEPELASLRKDPHYADAKASAAAREIKEKK
jgi:tetratricopeptide (TPR) repeat protein